MDKDIFRYLHLVTELGLVIVVTIVIGVGFGMFVDSKAGTKGIFTLIFMGFGVIGGFVSAYKIIKKLDG